MPALPDRLPSDDSSAGSAHGLPLSRRRFLGLAASCGAHLAFLASASPLAAREVFGHTGRQQGRKIVVEEPWGRIEELADGVWALVSTPVQDRKTLCNGAILAGKHGVLAVEAFGSPEGARWLSDWAERLTRRRPDDVLVTHYHADHTNGIAGYAHQEGDHGKPSHLRATAVTRELVQSTDARQNRPADATRSALLGGATLVDPSRPTTYDLGGRKVHLVPRAGHTASDVTIELDEPSIVIAGDLLWNRIFPNYVDATPSVLARSVRELTRQRETVYVPGHGPIADAADLQRYTQLLDDVEAAARRAHERGTPAADAAKEYKVPESLGEWMMFSPKYYEVALGAWEKELKGS